MTLSAKLSVIALIVSILISTTKAAPNYNGCAVIGRDGKCRICYKSKLLTNGEGCGPLLPKEDKCQMHGLPVNRNTDPICLYCKQGYANQYTLSFDITQKCVKALLANCLSEVDYISGKIVQKLCVLCPNQEYSVINATVDLATCQKVPNPDPNCKWGSFYSLKDNNGDCSVCKEGYAIDSATLRCVKTVEEGCWIQGNGKCTACNPYEGYSINTNGTCFKTITTSQADPSWDSLASRALGSLGGFGLKLGH